MTTDTKEPEEEVESQEDVEQAQRRSQLVTFLANNILNNAPLSKVVELVKTAALNDASKMVEDASEEDLEKLEKQFEESQNPS
jgi:hypothetical protein